MYFSSAYFPSVVTQQLLYCLYIVSGETSVTYQIIVFVLVFPEGVLIFSKHLVGALTFDLEKVRY